MQILSAVWNYFLSKRTLNWHFPVLVIATLVLMTVAGMVNIPGVLSSPQFTNGFDVAFIKDILTENPWRIGAYKLYFILDSLWAPILLLAIVKFVRRHGFKTPVNNQQKFLLKIYGLIALAAYGFDLTENIIYATQYRQPTLIYWIKIGLYTLLLAIWLRVLLRKYKNEIAPALKDLISSAWISILILLIIGAILPQAPQVNSIVVNLYEHPVNFIILLLFAPIYAVMLAHYPSYFNIKKEHRTWYRAKNYKLFLFGTVFYKYKDNYTDTARGKTESITNFLFRILGVFFYSALFYLIAYTSEVNFNWTVSMNDVGWSLCILGIYLLHLLRGIKNKWLNHNYMYLFHRLPNFYDGDFQTNNLNKIKLKAYSEGRVDHLKLDKHSLYTINFWVMFYIILFIITGIIHIFLFYFLYDQGYTQLTSILALIGVTFQLATFIFYRTFRSVFRFTFFNPNIKAVLNAFYVLREFNVTKGPTVSTTEIAHKKDRILTFFRHHEFKKNWVFRLFSNLAFGVHSNNIFFLQFAATIGLINMAFFMLMNYNTDWTLMIKMNAILVILSAFFLFYGIIIVLTKNYIYYKYSNETHAATYKKTFFRVIWSIFILLIVSYGLARAMPNTLFTLEPVGNLKEDLAQVNLDQYVKNLSKDDPRYYIGSYGGGMKANAWTLTVLNDLYQKDNTFFDKTIGMSGASGGTIGIINMAAIMGQYPTDTGVWKDKITAISTENILSLDLTHVLGRDLFNRMFIPGEWDYLRGRDRSSKAMYRYAKLVHNEEKDFRDIAYQDYWQRLYKTHDQKFPILITNSTNVRGNHGMGVSVPIEAGTIQSSYVFQGANDILDLKDNKSLSYYDAASTSNRFPVISPAAKIETKGHYNDGGIFENSGLLSAFKLFRAVNALEGVKNLDSLNQPNIFINIVNDKNQYIKQYLRDYLANLKVKLSIEKINEDTEINAIVNSIASTEMMPIYVKEELERLSTYHDAIVFKKIFLPHRFTVENIKSLLGKELKVDDKNNTHTIKILYDCVKQNNDEIESLINPNQRKGKIPIIEPPMSRVLAKEAYHFMLDMLEHPVPKGAINDVVNEE